MNTTSSKVTKDLFHNTSRRHHKEETNHENTKAAKDTKSIYLADHNTTLRSPRLKVDTRKLIRRRPRNPVVLRYENHLGAMHFVETDNGLQLDNDYAFDD